MDERHLLQVRSFNRTVGERIGALHDRFLDRDRPMAESRLLWEIGSAGAEIRELRRRLTLDSGYVTRLLHSLAQQGLVTVTPSQTDARVRRAELTAAGRAEWAELDRRSDAVATQFLAPLSDRQCDALVTAMATVERLLTASLVTLTATDPSIAEARWCMRQYFDELNARFETGFDPTLSISADVQELTPPSGLLLVARLRDESIGCGALKLHDDGVAELKRMWVAPSVRGVGIGRRLLDALEQHARVAGAKTIHLETNQALTEAIALYRRHGYREVAPLSEEPYAHHWFGKQLSIDKPATG
jgi:DNA-binding MarR family transcriptional regulator/predicted N-acetyltransferase YhbS